MTEEHEKEKHGILLTVEGEAFSFIENIRNTLDEQGWEIFTQIGFDPDSGRYGFLYTFRKPTQGKKVMIRIIYKVHPERQIIIKAGLAPPWASLPEWKRTFSVDELEKAVRFWHDICFDLGARYGVF